MGYTPHRRKNHRAPLRAWEYPDTPLHFDQLRELFGEETFLQEYLRMGSFKDILGGHNNADEHLAVNDDDFQKQFPNLFMLLAARKDDDGKPRLTCTMTIVLEDGQVKCGINERNHNLSLWTSTERVGAAFQALEEALCERPVKWRRSNWKSRKSGG